MSRINYSPPSEKKNQISKVYRITIILSDYRGGFENNFLKPFVKKIVFYIIYPHKKLLSKIEF